MMRRLRWVIVVLCLSVSPLLFSQLTSASAAFHVDEAATRVLLDARGTKVSLALVNPAAREFPAHVRLEVLDPAGAVRASSATDEVIKGGTDALLLSLPLQLAGLDSFERKAVLWYRLRYSISPRPAADGAVAPIEGVVSLSEITPDIFELRIMAPERAREGLRYRARARAVHPITSRPVAGVQLAAGIAMSDGAKSAEVRANGVTDAEGYALLDFDLPPRISDDGELEIKVVATRGVLVEETEGEIELEREALLLLSTDKPIYQPGQTLHLRALCFDGSKQALSGASVRLVIDDPEGTTVLRAPLQTSRFGIASLDWPIPENTRLGDYSIKLKLEDERYEDQEATQSVKISRYDLPNFAVGVKPDRPYYLPGQDAEIEVRADYLFGQPVKRGRVRLVRETERRWSYREQKWETTEGEKYEGEADADGRYRVRVNLQQQHASLAREDYSRYHDLTYAAYFTDPTTNRTEARRFDLRLTKDAIHIYVFEGIERQTKNFPLQFYLSTYYADGTPAQCEVRINDADEAEDDAAERGHFLRSVKTNRYGVAKVSGLVLHGPEDEEQRHASLDFFARDRKGTRGRQANTFSYAAHPVIRLETDKSLYRAGQPIKATITASEPLMRLFVDVRKGTLVLRSEVVELKGGRATLVIPYEAAFDTGVTLAAYAPPNTDSDGYYDVAAASRQVIYPRERDLRLSVKLSQPSYRPGEEAHADFSVAAPDGSTVESALGVIVFDKAVEERARTDRDFGSNYGFYAAYRYLSGYSGELSGVSSTDLFKLNLSKPVAADLALVAEILLRADASVPRVFGGGYFEMNQQRVFASLVERQTAPAREALARHYAHKMDHPRDAAGLRALLGAAGVDFDRLLDPWNTPYRAQFSTVRETDVLEIISAGADKRFQTADDFTVNSLKWPYFRPLGEKIDQVVASYHARTGGFIRDDALLKKELRDAGVDSGALRDRWGHDYHFDFRVSGTNYLINVTSKGPDGRFWQSPGWSADDFYVWTTSTDFFAEARDRMDKALSDFAQSTGRFPQNQAELRAALDRSNISFDDLRDPWGRSYYATFTNDAPYTVRHVIRSYGRYEEAGKLRQELTPVVQQMNYVHVQSRGEDGKEETADDFYVANFSRLLAERSASTGQLRSTTTTARRATTYSGASGAISGNVTDVNDGTVSNVSVTATHLTTGEQYIVSSDDGGLYLLRNLPVGLYRIEFTVANFATLQMDQVPVRSSNVTKLDARLQVAGATETVTVSAGSGAPVDVSASSTTITSAQITSLPLQRSVQSLFSVGGARSRVATRSGDRSAGVENNFMVDGVSDQMETPRLREHFSETLVWQPQLETDAAGRAALNFKLADNITTWKMAVVSSTVDGRIGISEQEFQAFQPFFVEHDPPRILTEGDEIQLPVVVRNYLDKHQDVQLRIAPADWFTLTGPAEKRVAVPAGDSSRQTFDFRASASVKDGGQQITALAAGGSDAILKPVSVHPDGEEVSTTDSQILTRSATLNLNLSPNAIKNSARGELKIYPNLMAHVFESIEGILRRPYGCGEQTISSTYPSLLVLSHDRRTGRPSAVAPKALRYLRSGYERLLNYRTAAGGFSYWGGRQEADLALTAYALRFLNEAKEFIAVDEAVIGGARDWLVAKQREDGSWGTTGYHAQEDNRGSAMLTAYIARVLAAMTPKTAAASVQPPDARSTAAASQTKSAAAAALSPLQRALAYLSSRIEKIDEPYLIASYALSARDAGETATTSRAAARLRSLMREENNTGYWALETSTPFYGWGLAGRIEATALALQALAREDKTGDNALVNRGLLFLLRQKDRYGVWYSTQATINVLDTMMVLLTREGRNQATSALSVAADKKGAGGPIEVIVNGQRATAVQLPPADQPANPIAVDLSAFLIAGDNRIELRREDSAASPASVQAVATYYVPWAAGGEGREINRPATAPSRGSSALSLGVGFDRVEAKIGDEVTCKVRAERIAHAGYGMLLAEIGLPPGADVDRASLEKAMKESGSGLSRYDILPDRLVVYLWPQSGGTSFEFKFRPRYGLTAQTAPSQLYDYYNPEARTLVAPTKFVVR